MEKTRRNDDLDARKKERSSVPKRLLCGITGSPPDYMYIILSHASVHHSEEPRVQERSKFFASSARNCDYAGYPQVLFLFNEPSTTFHVNIGYQIILRDLYLMHFSSYYFY